MHSNISQIQQSDFSEQYPFKCSDMIVIGEWLGTSSLCMLPHLG